MLIIKGICLLLSCLPTSHTTVRAVRHTAVSRFFHLTMCGKLFSVIPQTNVTPTLLADSVLSL